MGAPPVSAFPSSRVFCFTDPHPYQAAILAAEAEIFPTAKGAFRAELTQINLGKLWLQSGCETLPRVYRGTFNADRAPIGFLTKAGQRTFQHCGLEVGPGDIIVNDARPMHRVTRAPCHWGSLSLSSADLASITLAVAGCEVTVPSVAYLVRPARAQMQRLLAMHEATVELAGKAPDVLARPEVARALEQELIHAMTTCLTEGTAVEMSSTAQRHSAVIARLEEVFAANADRALYLIDVCAATGVSERTLRTCCQEHLGMGPVHYLWLRRMHLAHNALMRADPAVTTVTRIATDFGFWELGRFAVDHRTMFGESPSASLHRPPQEASTLAADRLFASPVSGFA
jgi:AraC-like DNA-binding protein